MTSGVPRVPIDAPAVARGLGFFETLLVWRGQPALADRHLRRLLRSVALAGFPAPQSDQVFRATRHALGRLRQRREAALRWYYLAVGSALDSPGAWRFFATAGPVPKATEARQRRGRVALLPSRLFRGAPELKTTSYASCVIGLREALRSGADEGLFVDGRGRVREGTATNVFAIRGSTLLTPPASSGILPGVVREWVIENAPRVGLSVRERPLSRADLLTGSFMTGSLTGLAPIRRVDGAVARLPGEGFRRLLRLYQAEVLLMLPRKRRDS